MAIAPSAEQLVAINNLRDILHSLMEQRHQLPPTVALQGVYPDSLPGVRPTPTSPPATDEAPWTIVQRSRGRGPPPSDAPIASPTRAKLNSQACNRFALLAEDDDLQEDTTDNLRCRHRQTARAPSTAEPSCLQANLGRILRHRTRTSLSRIWTKPHDLNCKMSRRHRHLLPHSVLQHPSRPAARYYLHASRV